MTSGVRRVDLSHVLLSPPDRWGTFLAGVFDLDEDICERANRILRPMAARSVVHCLAGSSNSPARQCTTERAAIGRKIRLARSQMSSSRSNTPARKVPHRSGGLRRTWLRSTRRTPDVISHHPLEFGRQEYTCRSGSAPKETPWS